MRKAHVKVSLLKPHERTDSGNLRKIHAEVSKAGAVYPLLVDKKTLVVLDGHHRLAILKKLGIEKAPVILVDYFGKDVSVGSWKKGKIITKEEVIGRGLTGKLFSPKTSRHVHKFKARKPAKLIISRK
ncbi:MAG: ParB N-terminal domain-containing protein [Candidatus Micrarchaeia archaeon]